VKTVSTAVTAVPASIAKNMDTAIDGITRAFVNKDLRRVHQSIFFIGNSLLRPSLYPLRSLFLNMRYLVVVLWNEFC
jgi:hypothetical protein